MMSMLITARLYLWVPDRGPRQYFWAAADHNAQEYAAEAWRDTPGMIFRTDDTAPAEQFDDGHVRLLTAGRYTLSDDIEHAG